MQLDSLYSVLPSCLSLQHYLPLLCGINMCWTRRCCWSDFTGHSFCSCGYELSQNFTKSVAVLHGNSSDLLSYSGHFQFCLFPNISLVLNSHLSSFPWFWILQANSFFIPAYMSQLSVFLVTPFFLYFRYWNSHPLLQGIQVPLNCLGR